MSKRYVWFFSLALFLALSSLFFPSQHPTSRSLFNGRQEHSVAAMYGKDDLSASCLFAGDLMNFGYWENPIEEGPISTEQRVESEKNLYRFVIGKLGIERSDAVLEVGCAKGGGTAFIYNEFAPTEIHGIDICSAQLKRAERLNAKLLQENGHSIFFREGAAEKIPYGSDRFDKVISVQAAQHFESLEQFASETYRVLKPGGKIAFCTFFGTSDESRELLSPLIQTIWVGIDHVTPIYYVADMFKREGFRKVEVVSIGEHVWHGFDQWVAQTELKDCWGRHWYPCYKQGAVDYYVVTAEK